MVTSSQIFDTSDSMSFQDQTGEMESKEQQLNVWIPKSLMKKLKVKGVQDDKSLKQLVINALDQYL